MERFDTTIWRDLICSCRYIVHAVINAARLSQSSCYARPVHELQPWLQHLLQCYAPPLLGYVNGPCMSQGSHCPHSHRSQISLHKSV